jgi:hypothetical protein
MKSSLTYQILKALLVFTAVFFTAFLLWEFIVGNTALDINLHDTYFVLNGTFLWAPTLASVFVMTTIYLVIEAFYSYKRVVQNVILMTGIFLSDLGLLLLFRPVLLIVTVVDQAPGWTIYPPLSALPMHQPKHLHVSHFSDTVWLIFTCSQIIFIITLTIIALLTGRNWNRTSFEKPFA